jgi:hypothetical protein
MKWRTSAVYLLILLLIGGYFYYFEVVKKEQKDAAEHESKRVLAFNAEGVKTIEILSREAKPVQLEKQDKWRISAPMETDIDRTAFDGFFSALKNLERERKLETAQGNLEAYGLQNPSLKIRILSGDQWTELLMGDKNPAGESRYAKTSAAGDVFLVPQRSWDALNKSLRDLRKKELFSWQPEQVTAMEVKGTNGEWVKVERDDGSRDWHASNRLDLKIKNSKVEDLLNQLHWLRATDFLEENAEPVPLNLSINLELKDGEHVSLALGDADPNTKQAVALVSTNPVPVKVASYFFKDIPRTIDFLTDRSLLPGEPDAVSRVKWKMGDSEGEVVKVDENTWGTRQGDAKPKPLKDSFPVKSLLGDAGSIEYTDEFSYSLTDPSNFIEFWAGDNKLSTVAWVKLPAAPGEAGPVRLERDGLTRTINLEYDSTERLKNSLDELGKAVQGK